MTEPANPLVVVADDDPTVRLLYEQSLAAAGFDVKSFPDGAAVLEGLAALRPDIILLDVEMPAADGFTVCREVRAQPELADVPIVMVTGHDDTESINRAYELGATDFVRKPIAWAVLPHRIRYLLRANTAFIDLKHFERKTRALLKTIPDMMLSIEANGLIREFVSGDTSYANSLNMHAGQPLEVFFPEDVAKNVREHMRIALSEGGIQVYEHRLDDSRRHCETRLIAQDEDCVLLIVRDVTEQRKSAAKIHQLAYYDHLTGLPNRQRLIRDLKRTTENAKRNNTSIAILFIDLDRFKRINDTLGHSVGDVLLKSVAQRLNSCVRVSDCVARLDPPKQPSVQLARLGGDEFVILITDIAGEDEVSVVATRIGEALSAPFSVEGHQFVVTPSIGIAMFPSDGDNVEDLLMNADAAMYRAKASGRNKFKFYSHTMRMRSLERLDLEAELRKAIEHGEFRLHYQPKVSVSSWSIVGVEALLRWPHPERGWISPGDFIPLAEETGLIVELGEWVIREACAQLKRWQDQGLDDVSIAVNVSSQQFCHSDLLDTVLKIVWDTGIRPQRLELEITESLLMTNLQDTVSVLQAFREAGIQLSVDDFGTGYSSLAYLKQFPLNSLKIDRSFVQGLHESRDDAAICAAILAMARELGLKVVAEGVELEEQLDFLREQGCDEIQGFLFSKPLPTDELEELLRSGDNQRLMVGTQE